MTSDPEGRVAGEGGRLLLCLVHCLDPSSYYSAFAAFYSHLYGVVTVPVQQTLFGGGVTVTPACRAGGAGGSFTILVVVSTRTRAFVSLKMRLICRCHGHLAVSRGAGTVAPALPITTFTISSSMGPI